MKRFGKIAVCLAGGLAMNASLFAQDLSVTNNPLGDDPYAPIAVRNVFGLTPPAPPPDPSLEAEKSLPKITPNGIMSVYGHWKVLFKTSGGSKPGQPAKDMFYDLAEGEMQDDIEVTRVDAQDGVVTFSNHGTEQEIPLASTAASGGGGGGGGSPGGPAFAPDGNNGKSSGPNGSIIHFGGHGSGGPNGGANGAGYLGAGGGPNNGANIGLNFGAAPTANNLVTPQFQNTASPEARVLLMEAQRLQWQQQQNANPALNPTIIPPTPLTQLNTQDGGEPPAP
jgi:hypothetical protein